VLVTGQVREYEGGQPLPNVKVTVRQLGAVREARTDRSGTFTLEKVPALPSLMVDLSTEPRTHISEWLPVPPARDGRAELGTVRLLKVDPGNPNKGRLGLSYGEGDGQVVVSGVLPDSPAARAGLQKGDAIVEIDGKKVVGADMTAVTAAMRGDPGKELTLVVQTPGAAPRTVKLKRAM
jgi:S1-C subfamily serine protease